MMLLTVIFGYVLLSLLVALFSLKKRLGFMLAFYISLLLTPIAGIWAVMKSDDFLQISRHVTTYHCAQCNHTFTEHFEICPNCLHNQLEIQHFKEEHLTVV